MKVYKTSYYREIKELEAFSIQENTITAYASVLSPDNNYHKTNDRLKTIDKKQGQVNYFNTLDEAKDYNITRIRNEIKKQQQKLDRLKDTYLKMNIEYYN